YHLCWEPHSHLGDGNYQEPTHLTARCLLRHLQFDASMVRPAVHPARHRAYSVLHNREGAEVGLGRCQGIGAETSNLHWPHRHHWLHDYFSTSTEACSVLRIRS